MKTLMITIQKGGQGKSMLAVHLAVYAAKQGLKTLVLDLDVQANSSWTLEHHDSGVSSSQFIAGEFSGIQSKDNLTLVHADDALADLEDCDLDIIKNQLQQSLNRCQDQFDLCIIDTPPTLGLPIIAAGNLADYAVAPLELELYSVQGVSTLMRILDNLRNQNPKLEFLGIIPNRLDRRRPRLLQNLEYLKESFGDYVAPLEIRNWDSIAESLENQSNIWESRKTSARLAKKHMSFVCQYLLEKMGFKK